jgi:uncharacterized protein (TIGR02118 family)
VQNKAKPGDVLDIKGPFGAFFYRQSDHPPIFIAGSTGLAPNLAMLRQLADALSPQPLRLFFGVTNAGDLFCEADLHELAQQLPQLACYIACINPDTHWRHEVGLVTESFMQHMAGEDFTAYDYYICGPPAMIEAVSRILHEKGVDSYHIFREEFIEQYRPPIMPVDEFLTIEKELCEVLTKVRGERWWEMSQQELRAYRGAAIIKEKNEQPHTLMVLYPVPPDQDAFEREYVNERLSLARKLPAKAIQTEVVTGALTGDGAPYHRIAALHFEDLQSLQQCAQTPEAKAALEHAVKISSGGKPHFLVLESDLAIDEEPGKERPPVKLMVCFPHPKEKDAFETAYFSEILPETLKLPAKRFKGYKVVATADSAECSLHRILVFCFDNQTDLESCMTSTRGKALTNILMRTSTPPYLFVTVES